MDEKDIKILEILKTNSKLRMEEISRMTGIPLTTIHSRIKRMETNGIIEGYTTKLNYYKLGRPVEAYILITVDYDILKNHKTTQHQLAGRLKSLDAVEEACIIAGEKDLIIKVRSESIQKLSDVVTKDIRNIDGVEKTITMIVLERM